MTVQEAAKILELSPSTVYDLCARKQLGHVKVGAGRRVIRISPADVSAYLAGRRVEPADGKPEPKPRKVRRVIPDFV
jgi:excisionase family DNA binding protein